ncbi:MAG: beta-N-acetylhexosaminidase [Hyphomicrobiales bacterium]|nr:beta-N-acetylhexosaminidase [Hyphomicrobiales bacterium]
MAVHALIFGCGSTMLSATERAFFKDVQPWGLILFKRNVADRAQLLRLTQDFRDIVGREDAPVLIDQEGGRVQRLGPPHWPAYPSASSFARIGDPLLRRAAVRLGARLIAHDLRALGITVDCLPVLDVPVAEANQVISDRAYGTKPEEVAISGRAAAEGLLAGGVLPVIKHIPGHGRAMADSHHALPRVTASREALVAHDFAPFRALADMPLAMTAHVVFAAVDEREPATLSRRMFAEVIRGEIGYDGLVMTDDLSMNALSGSFADRTRRAYAAGCDIVLHCNGEREEMEAVAAAARPLSGKAQKRAEIALARIRHEPEPFDSVDGRARFEDLLAGSR